MSCDSVRAAADLFHDALDGTNCRFHPAAVPDGAVIFVNALLLDDFAANKAPFIATRFVLVTHCSDAPAPDRNEVLLAHPQLAAWSHPSRPRARPSAPARIPEPDSLPGRQQVCSEPRHL
jgi:hypothetical protein